MTKGFSFRVTLTSYYRGFRIIKTWDEPGYYPNRMVGAIMGFISFVLILRNDETNWEPMP